jgi:hypothetical protein
MNTRKVFFLFLLLFGISNKSNKFKLVKGQQVASKMVKFVCENITKTYAYVKSTAILVFENNLQENLVNQIGTCIESPFMVLDFINPSGNETEGNQFKNQFNSFFCRQSKMEDQKSFLQ